MFGKRGISPVIATVLLLVLTLVAVAILAAFIVPFVKNSLSDSSVCYDVLNDLTIEDATGYNCNVEGLVATTNTNGKRTGFSVRVNNDEIIGFKLGLFKQGQSSVYEVRTNAGGLENIRMLGGDFNTTNPSTLGFALEMPEKGGVRTYVANDGYDKVELSPLLKTGKICDVSDYAVISPCLATNIKADLLAR